MEDICPEEGVADIDEEKKKEKERRRESAREMRKIKKFLVLFTWEGRLS